VDCTCDLSDWNITFWTSTEVYAVTISNDSQDNTVEKLFGTEQSHKFNITNAVSVDNLVLFTGWSLK